MSPRRRKRLDPAVFELSAERIKAGEFSDRNALLAAQAARASRKNTRVLVQVMAKHNGWLSGIDETIAMLKQCVDDWSSLIVDALYEGDIVEEWDAVLTIEGEYEAFAHLETAYLGVLSHRTLVCTNIHRIADAARPKTVMFLGARDDHYAMQAGDGFAAMIGGAKAVSTSAQASLWGGKVVGTVPHSLIAALGGDTTGATRQVARLLPDDAQLLALVDYENDVVKASVDVARALGDRLWAVRLDTSRHMVDRSVISQMGTFEPAGVSPQLVWNVRNALDAEGFGHIQIVVSGGFDVERIREFEEEGTPVDAYGIGAAAYRGSFGFASDVVLVGGKPQARAGRALSPNPKLERVK